MNFLMRPAQTAAATAAEQPSVSAKYMADANYASKDGMTLGGLMAEDTYPQNSKGEDQGKDPTDGIWGENGSVMGASSKSDTPIVENYIDVAEEEGWITIPYSTSASSLCHFSKLFNQVLAYMHVSAFHDEKVHIFSLWPCLSMHS